MGKINADLANLIGDAKTQTSELQDFKTNESSKPKPVASKKKPSPPSPANSRRSKPLNSKTSKKKPSSKKASDGPKYSALVPKEARLREEQIAGLNDLARKLARNRTDKTERITSNTLIRIAVDHLLAIDASKLSGKNEDELKKSLMEEGAKR